jgi:hypothetical protein
MPILRAGVQVLQHRDEHILQVHPHSTAGQQLNRRLPELDAVRGGQVLKDLPRLCPTE